MGGMNKTGCILNLVQLNGNVEMCSMMECACCQVESAISEECCCDVIVDTCAMHSSHQFRVGCGNVPDSM